MSKITITKVSPSEVLIPQVGTVTIFMDEADDILKYKNSDDDVFPIGASNIEGDIILEAVPPILGDIVNFSHSDYGSEVDIISIGITEITRGVNQPIFNQALEGYYNYPNSPSGTEWNSVFTDGTNYGFGDLSNVTSRVYSNFAAALGGGGNIGNNILTTELVMHDLNTGKYYTFQFTSWTSGGAGGGFAYTRQEIEVQDQPVIVFPDNTVQTTAAGIPVAGNNIGVTESIGLDGVKYYTIDNLAGDTQYANIAFVDPLWGNNGTAQWGKFNKPYQSVSQAISAVQLFASSSSPSLVVLRKGTYSGFSMQPNVHVFCEPGVEIVGTLFGNSIGSGQYSKFFGFARFNLFFGWAILMDAASSSGGRLDIECDSIEAGGMLSVNYSPTVKIKCNWSRCSGYNGGAYCVRVADTADVTINIREYFHAQHTLFYLRRGSANIPFNGRLVVNCPELAIVPTYTVNYGNVNTAILQSLDAGAGTVIINGDCRINRPSTSTPAFTFQTQYTAPTKVLVNGSIYGRDNHCIWTGYIGWFVDIEVNGDLVSNISPINCYLNNTNVDPGASYITVRNSKIIGYANILGVSRYIRFWNCSFYNYADGVLYPTAPNITWQNDQLGQVKRAQFYNCIAEANGASSEFMEFAGSGLTDIMLVGCYGNKPVGTGLVASFSDYVQVPSLSVPKNTI